MECYICQSAKRIENHHIDCSEGEISDETIPLCKRCHRTYHDLGVEWFDDEVLDKAIELENRRRALFGLSPLRREDIKRSDYWYKKHGTKRPRIPQRATLNEIKRRCFPHGDPLCGWDWMHKHLGDEYPEPRMELAYDGELIATLTGKPKRGFIRAIVEGSKHEQDV